jgi:cyclic-di-GMP-binding protein
MAANPPARPASGPFSDSRGCKDWLGGLPLTNIPQAQQLVLEGLRAFNRGDLEAMERLKCLELMREKVAFLQTEQRSRYFGKSLPLSPNDQTAWTTGRALLEEMEAGYRVCLAAAQEGGSEIARLAPLAAQRVMRHLGAQMLFHAMVYRRFDPALWLRLHGEFAAAESAGRADERVKDSLEGEEGLSSIREAYVSVLLMQAADLAEMAAPQMDFVEALVRMWSHKVRLLAEATAGTDPGSTFPLAVDLAEPAGAVPLRAGDRRPSHRVLDVEQVSRSIRRRIKALQAGEEPAALGLPAEAGTIDLLAQLQRLHRLWCDGAPRAPSRIPEEKSAALAFGIPEIHYFLSEGVVFEQPDKPRELTRQEKDDIAVFGAVTDRTRNMRAVDHNFGVENWAVVDEMLGAWRLLRPSTASRGVAIGRIVAVRLRDRGPFYLGMIKALVQETDGRIEITVALFPGKPEPIAVRGADSRTRQGASWTQGFRLPPLERLGIPESLVVPTGIAARGRGIELWDGGPKDSTVHEILERGTDFDRVTAF